MRHSYASVLALIYHRSTGYCVVPIRRPVHICSVYIGSNSLDGKSLSLFLPMTYPCTIYDQLLQQLNAGYADMDSLAKHTFLSIAYPRTSIQLCNGFGLCVLLRKSSRWTYQTQVNYHN